MSGISLAQATAFFGIMGSAWLSGINFSASHLTLPTLYPIDTKTSTVVFEDLFYRGGWLTVPLTIFATICNGVTAYLYPEKRLGYILATIATGVSMPWTGLVMMPHIMRICAIANDSKLREKTGDKVIVQMLKKWKWQNNIRSSLAGLGGVTGMVVLMS